MKKRILSAFLAALMLLTCLPVFASASGIEVSASVTSTGIKCLAKRGSGDSRIVPNVDLEGQSGVCGELFYGYYALYPNGKNDQSYVIEIYTGSWSYLTSLKRAITGTEEQELEFWFTTGSLSAGTYYLKCYVVDAYGNMIPGSASQSTIYLVRNAIALKSLTAKNAATKQTLTGYYQLLPTDDPLRVYLTYNPYNASGARKMKVEVSKEGVVVTACLGGYLYVAPIGIGKVTITVTVNGVSTQFGVEVPDPSDPCYGYRDIDRSAWYHKAADFVISRKLMGSTRTDMLTFEPSATCTRAMIATMLYSLSNKPPVTFEAKFPDVKKSDWYASAVIWAYQNGVVSGYDNGLFGPNNKVTREQMAVILKAYAEKVMHLNTSKVADLSGFPDCGKVTWSKAAMRWAVAEGLISGKAKNGVNYLDPQGNATRAEVAAILKSFITKVLGM